MVRSRKFLFAAGFFMMAVIGHAQKSSNMNPNKLSNPTDFYKDSIAMVRDFQVVMPKIPILPVFKNDTINIQSKGAIGDGLFFNTEIINQSIETLSKRGGGVVYIPGGIYLTGPIVLKNNINLHLAQDAILLFTTDKSKYQLIKSEWEGKIAVRNQSPIYGEDLNNIAITGRGIINGNGQVWRSVKKDKLNDNEWKDLLSTGGILSDNKKTWYPSESYIKGNNTKDASVWIEGKSLEDYVSMKDFFRPNLLVLKNCKNVLLQDATFENSAAWCLHTLMCDGLSVKNVRVKNPDYAQNGDGIDIESCQNILVEGCSFDVGDDGICIKSGRDEFGRKRGMPTQNAIIRGNVVYHAHGGFVIGSEMSGGAKNIFVYNNSFIGTDNGLRFKTVRGRGGIVSNIYISNIYMKDIVNDAILFDMYYFAEPPKPGSGKPVAVFPVTEATPQFRDFKIKNIACAGAERGLFIRGLPEMNIKNISLENITLQAKTGVEISEATNIDIKNLKLEVSDPNQLVNIHSANKIQIIGLSSDNKTSQVFTIGGEKTTGISVSGLNTPNSTNKVDFINGANKNSINIQ